MLSPMPNKIQKGRGFYVSYNKVDKGIYGEETTALVDEDMTTFYILNGNHMDSYSQIIENGYEACLGYFTENIGEINKLSSLLKKDFKLP